MNSRGSLDRKALFVLVLLLVAVWGGWEGWRMYNVPPAPTSVIPVPPALPVPAPAPPIFPAPKPVVAKKALKPLPPKPRPLPVKPPPPAAVTPVRVAPPLPPPPPPGEWIGTDTSIKHDGQVVIHNDHQWISFWAEHHPDEASPDVDFSKQMVIGVFAGPRPAEQFAIRIMGMHVTPGGLVVDYQEKLPPPGTFAVDVTVYPYDIKAIPIVRGPVKFNKLAVIDPSRISR